MKRADFNNKISQVKLNNLKSNNFRFDHFAQNSKILEILKLTS